MKHNYRRSDVFIYTKICASLPFIDVDLNLTLKQKSILINGSKYIIPCQSRFSQKSIDELVKTEFERVSKTVKKCLNDNRMSITDERAKRAFPELERIIHDLYSKPLSGKLRRRACREYKRVKRLQQLLRSRPDIIICRIDKNPAFYIGNVATIAAKAQEYMDKTGAYQEITDGHCPLANNLRAVQTLLDYLVKQKAITKSQSDKLLPSLDKLELAHFHGLPKVHKVKTFFSCCTLYSLPLLFIAGYVITTYSCWYTCTNDITFEIIK
jgi:hypothetical protein